MDEREGETIEPETPQEEISFACPECQGPLREYADGPVTRFRCHTGHLFSAESLLEGEIDEVERALWSALRALDEGAALARRLEARAHASGDRNDLARRYRERAAEHERGSATIRNLLKRAVQNAAAD